MTINANLYLSNEKAEITLVDTDSKINIFYSQDALVYDEIGFFLLYKGKQFQAIHSTLNEELISKADHFIQIIPPKSLDISHLSQRLSEIIQENNVYTLLGTHSNQPLSTDSYLAILSLLLNKFGFPLTSKKKTSAKPQHRWKQALSEVEFFVNDFDSQATIIWQKRNEMLIKKGAQLRKEYKLNRDGTIGLNVRMGIQLREEQKDKLQNFVTTEDIILKSVNEVGLFLYYGGTNSWLILKDKDNKTIDEWSK
ncbi:hypothetical protein C7K38_06100 [Tetragenococcus osmophilus]|uniref:Uncharacterized protein n=1 Tax=Tetragenococcus osmophilus TaxID=526944 RepID=A0AA37XM35_9ENTE|nr:hypothetical protein [Tetragenococcus osmophilus]AYW47971.1 hypothetical protein C7K38_06100 [Tetragenococcus osmophilus]GMA53689.1 hypothetical protein GCM10025857_50460 [Alicyclobacillus contaminans]GMA72380.1 hypothetical protein GCM10025885_14290 [Tetragenococcus osmophilus]